MGLLRSAARVILGVDILFLLLLAFSFYYLEPGTGPYVTAQLTLVPVVLSFVLAAVVIRTGWEPF
ncbi:hypothetical protein [Halosimplex halophilum]|uniref:hypothetical protein n=1 Tax=Halosimplex halophilum TaxID=2559572 RepID=UPI00107F2E93|nr:hypothetical protein [Halosimplex halophilum]